MGRDLADLGAADRLLERWRDVVDRAGRLDALVALEGPTSPNVEAFGAATRLAHRLEGEMKRRCRAILDAARAGLVAVPADKLVEIRHIYALLEGRGRHRRTTGGGGEG